MPKNSSTPRFREIIEGALGNVIGAIVLAVLGIAGGVTIGWLPTFIVLLVLVGGFVVWYQFDPAFQRLISQRLFKIRHAISGEGVVLSRWNLIANETILDISKQNNLYRGYLIVESRKNINFSGKEYLEIVVKYRITGKRWLAVVDSNGNVVDLYGNVQAQVNECSKCGSTVLVLYWELKNGMIMTEPQTVCRRCKNIMAFSYYDPEHSLSDSDKLSVKDQKATVQVKDGIVSVLIGFSIHNHNKQKVVRPEIQLRVALLNDGNFVEKLMSVDLEKITLPPNVIRPITYRWNFPLGTVVLAEKPGGLKITLSEL